MQNKFTHYFLVLFTALLLLSSCSDNDDNGAPIAFTTTEYQVTYELTLGDPIIINPEISNLDETVKFQWLKDGVEIATTQELNFLSESAEAFTLQFIAISNTNSIERSYEVKISDPYALYFRAKTETSSQFISKVMQYLPAPGQFINSGFGTPEAAEKIVGSKTNTLSLGAWGGYVIFTFDHTIENAVDSKDFVVYGNAFKGGSEPGIVQVAFDSNGNGIADDKWYELAGSNYTNERTIKNYQVTYTNPGSYKDVSWTDNKGSNDVVAINSYHTQNYYPLFATSLTELVFKGTRVFPIVNVDRYVSIDALEWGYADNYDAEYSKYGGNVMDINWAVDDNGNPVNLKGIDFVKVYTAAQYNAGAIGEISTEVRGAADLSMLK